MREKLVEITPEVEAVLIAARCEGERLTLQGQLDRALYVQVDKVLRALGGRWNRGQKCHVFAGDAAGIVAAAVSRGGAVNEKRTFEAFDTPPELAARLVEMAGVQPGDSALEPSAGRGAIVQALKDAGAHVRCVDIDPKAVAALRARFPGTAVHRKAVVHEGDFLNYCDGGWKRIVMNPPFSRQQAVDHVSHALDLLAPSGTLVAVMPAGVKTASLKRAVALMDRIDVMRGRFVDLPDDSFKASGTSVRTVALSVTGVRR